VKTNKTASTIVFILILNMIIIGEGVYSQPLPDNTIFIDPPSLTDEANILTRFTININVSNIEGLHGWSIKLRYNPALLYTNSSLIREGSFLKSGGSTLWAPPRIEEDYLAIGSMITDYAWADGSGTLANVTFVVRRRGETILHLFATKLDDVDINPILHTSQDGYFRNMEPTQLPTARYTYFAQAYNVSFNASSSYSPGGTIQSYLWFWDPPDSRDTNRSTSTTNPVTFHLYPGTIPPKQENASVKLIVTDSSNVTSNILVALITFGIAIHELAVLSVEASPHSVLIGNLSTTTVNVNISNNGNQLESTTVTLSYNSTYFDFQNITATQWTTLYTVEVNALAGFENRTVVYIWNTTGYAQGFYAIKAEASPVQGEENTTNNIQTGSMRIVSVLHAPVAIFTFNPVNPYAFERVVFNGSLSYDPDGVIERYRWNFGDSNSTTTTESSVTHAYNKAGNFSVTLTVTDDDAINKNATQLITVQKLATTTSVSVSPITTIRVGSTAVISGEVANVRSPVNVTIFKRAQGEGIWDTLTDLKTDQNGLFSHDWSPSTAGVNEFKAEWNGDDAYQGSTSNTILVAAKFSSIVTLSTNQTYIALGQTATLNGSINATSSGSTITIDLKSSDGSWNPIGHTVSDENGRYTFQWRPNSTGTHELRAMWNGDDQAFGSISSTITVVAKLNSVISLSTDQEYVSLGQAITLNGSISPTTIGAVVTIEYKLNNGSWNLLVKLHTDENGWFKFDWRPDSTGTYELRAKWTGSNQAFASESNTTTVTVVQNPPNLTTYALYAAAIIILIAAAAALAWTRRH